MLNKKIIIWLVFIMMMGVISAGLFLPASEVSAGPVLDGIDSFGSGVYGHQAGDVRSIAATIIKSAIGFLGIVAVIIIMYSGVMYMTSQGEKDKVTKAKNIILYAVIGLFIIILAYAITYFVFDVILTASGGDGGGAPVVDDGAGPGGEVIN